MEDTILNSLLRYSKQVTPARETYPVPYNGWSAELRKHDPGVNLSTYYLLDNPLLPSNRQIVISSCQSTTGISTLKRLPGRSFDVNSKKNREDQEFKLKNAENEIKIIVEREKKEREKFLRQQMVFENIEKKLVEKKNLRIIGENSSEESEYSKSRDDVVENMRADIEMLKKQLKESNQMIRDLQVAQESKYV
jgi:hypothetical protein